jgi:D-alanine transaminase
MPRIAYVNGAYVPHAQAFVHIEDRGYQFADGIYEYMAFYNRRLLDEQPHMARLERSLRELSIIMPMEARALSLVLRELIARNGREHGGLYLQVTRGVARRDHAFPARAPRPALTITIGPAKFPKPEEIENGVAVITHPEQRWARRDIKSIALLPNVLAKQAATAQKTREAWLWEPDGKVTEGAVSNAYIVDKAGTLITHPADHAILGGIAREVVLKLAHAHGMTVQERAFTLDEARQAAEAFITSTSINVLPVTRLDGNPIGDGRPGAVTKKLRALYEDHVYAQTGFRRP